jgi:hypothetical protein
MSNVLPFFRTRRQTNNTAVPNVPPEDFVHYYLLLRSSQSSSAMWFRAACPFKSDEATIIG